MQIKWYDAKKCDPIKSGEYLAKYGGYNSVHIESLYYSKKHGAWNCLDEFPEACYTFDIDAWAYMPTADDFTKELSLEK